MQREVMFAGFGGQGILLSGKILAEAAMAEGLEVAWIPSYGPEMRGGTAYCLVAISDQPIGSPIVRMPSHLVAMNRPSLVKFAPTIKPGGVIVINSSIIDIGSNRSDVDELFVPVTDIAKELGNVRVANIVALSAFVARSRIVGLGAFKNTVDAEFSKKPDLRSINLAAVEAGISEALKGR
jgi:2-oxoglutarate ferredoxin oxidoreductase subunit gamma